MKKICILYTNSGAGHKAVARALCEELSTDPEVKVEMVDFAKEYDIPIFKKSENIYKYSLENLAKVREYLVATANEAIPTQLLLLTYDLLAKKNYKRFLDEHEADLYISTYYFDNPLFKYIKKKKKDTPLIMMVTDIVFPLRVWFDPISDLTILPTQEIYELGLKYFKRFKEKIKVMGLPIASVFFKDIDKNELKKEMGIPQLPLIFISGGGEGMDQVPCIVKSIDKKLDDVYICVICGKDKKQKDMLERYEFRNRNTVLGWSDKFPEYLLCSDIFITKAGAISIWEAMSAKKRTIIYDFIKDQEKGNIDFAKKYFNAKYVTDHEEIAKVTQKWLIKEFNIEDNRYSKNWAREIVKPIIDLISSSI